MSKMLRAITKKYFKLLVSISLVASLGFGLISGLTGGYLTLKASLDSYVADYAYPDAFITTEVTSVSDADAIKNIEGVKDCDTRMCADTVMKDEDGDFYSVRVFTYSDDESQKFRFWSGDAENKEGVILEYKFAKNNGISVGDTVNIHVKDEYRPYVVGGIASRPETMCARISDRAWGLNYDFGYIYAPVELLTKEYEKDYKENKGKLDKESLSYKSEKDSAEKMLADKQKELEDAKELFASKQAQYLSSQQEAESAAATMRSTRAQLVASQQELESKQTQLDEAAAEITSKRSELESQYSQLSQAKSGLAEIDANLPDLQRNQSALHSPSVVNVVGQLSAMPYDTPMYSGMSQIELPTAFAEGEEEQAQEYIEYIEGADIDASALEAALGGVSVDSMTTGQAVSTYNSAVANVDSQVESLTSTRASIVSQLSAAGVDESTIDSSMSEIQSGLSELDASESELASTRAELSSGIAEIQDGIAQIDSSLSEISSQLSQGKSQLDAAEQEISEGDTQLRSAADELKQFSDLDSELKSAYKKLNEGEGYDKLVNQFLLYFNDSADPSQVLAEAEKALDGVKVKTSYVFADSPVKHRIDMNLDPLSTLMVFIHVLFFGIVLIVVFLFMSMIIRQSRREISILRALGFTKGSIRLLFCRVSIGVAVVGIILGCGIGYLLRLYAGEYFKDLLALPDVLYKIDVTGCVAGAAATVFVCVAATLLSTIIISRVSPKEAMSRPVQSSVKVNALTDKLLKRSSPMFKVGVINLLRNKGRFIFSTVCVAASVMLIFSSFSFITSKNYAISQTFEERIHYDCQIFLEDAPTDKLLEDIEKIDGVSKAEPLLIYNAKITSDKHGKTIDINAVGPDNDMIRVGDGSGANLPLKDGGIILDQHMADDLETAKGERIKINGIEFDVSSVMVQCANHAQYITLNDAKKLGKPDLGCIICTFDGNPRKELLSHLTDTDGYLYCVFTEAFYNDNKELYATYDFAALILVAFAMVIGFIIVFNTSMTDLQDNKRELCVLRTLGFQFREISRSRFFRALLQFVVAFIVGLIPGTAVAKYTLLQLSTPDETFLFVSGIFELAVTALPVFLYILFSHFASMHSMKKWNAAEVVKEKE